MTTQAATPSESINRAARVHIRAAILLAAALATAAVVASYAFAKARVTPIGTGVAVIDTTLAYQGGQAAGTGVVLTSSGEILTNNHVIRGATSIRIVIPGTDSSFTAKVVGYDVTDDVAVLQAAGAANLKTLTLSTSTGLKVGQTVKAIGNAGGGGSLVTTTGTITALNRTITVNDEAGATATLRRLIETNAQLEPGDSGGPLVNTAGQVIGIDAAASSSGGYRDIVSSDGYAIPINRAVSLAKQIVAGKASATVHVGSTAFLGISATSTADIPGYDYNRQGAVISAVLPGGPADDAGLVTGDVIIAINGKATTSFASLSRVILNKKPGARLTITYLDTSATTRTAHVTLVAGTPQ